MNSRSSQLPCAYYFWTFLSHTHTCIEHTTWCFGFFIQWVQINAKVIVEHRSTRNNLCCEKVLLSTIFGMVRSVINYHTIHIDVYATWPYLHLSLSSLIGMWCLVSYRAEYLWQGSRFKCMANFYKVIRNLKLNFTHHFAAHLEHFIIISFSMPTNLSWWLQSVCFCWQRVPENWTLCDNFLF